MGALTVNKQGIGFLEPTDILYLYCVDFQFLIDFNITSLPFMDLELVGGHMSFPDKLHERRIVFSKKGDIIRINISQQISPCVIEIVTCCQITIGTRQAVLVWDFIVKDDLRPVSTVKAALPVENDDAYLPMPWLNITRTNCNCNKYPTRGLIVQNTLNEFHHLHNNDGGHDDGEIIDEHDGVNDHIDGSVMDNEQVSLEQVDDIAIPEHEAVHPCVIEQQYTETFKLKGTSFHKHFQSALRDYKFCLLGGLEPPALSLHFEPVNKQDENAIVILAKKWYY